VHGFPDVGGCDRLGFRDKLNAVAWMCWKQKTWKLRLAKAFNLEKMTERGFMEWLELIGDDSIVNVLDFCMAFYHMRETEDDSERMQIYREGGREGG
jgi:hypothetical protein